MEQCFWAWCSWALRCQVGRLPLRSTLTAVVQDQQCQGGDRVNVTLTATLNPPQQNVQYHWDFNGDGIWDTQLNPNPTVSHLYPDEVNVTAVVEREEKHRTPREIRSPLAPCVAKLISDSVRQDCFFEPAHVVHVRRLCVVDRKRFKGLSLSWKAVGMRPCL